MIEKSTRSVRDSAASALAPWNMLSDMLRQQMAIMATGASTLFRSAEAMRKAQQHAAHQANLHYSSAASRLRGNCEPSELMSIQSELMRFDAQEAGRYWQQLSAAMLQAQMDWLSSANHLLDQESGSGLKSAFEAFQQAMPLAAPFFTGHSNGHAVQSRAS